MTDHRTPSRMPADARTLRLRPAPLASLLLLPLGAWLLLAGDPGIPQGKAGPDRTAGPGWAGQADCEFTAERNAEVDAAGAATLAVETGAGSLEIRGREDLDRVLVRGRACASDRALLEEIRLEADRDGDRVVVASRIRDPGTGERAALDLVLEVPASLAAELDDRSGPITVSLLSGLVVEDGSGSLEATKIEGPVRIDDGSGSIELAEIRGPVRVEDSSGSLSIRLVEGDVDVHDGSGGLTVRRIRGSVTIDDGSGDIVVDEVTGDLAVEDAGSGDLSIGRVAGRVTVED